MMMHFLLFACALLLLPHASTATHDESVSSSSFLRRGEAAVGHDKLECGSRLAGFTSAPVLPSDPVILYDALEIKSRCGGMSLDEVLALRTRNRADHDVPARSSQSRREVERECHSFPVGVGDGAYASIHEAIDAAKSYSCGRIQLPPGVIYLNETVKLGRRDSNIGIEGAADGSSWISGGVPITLNLSKQKSRKVEGGILFEIEIRDDRIEDVPGLFRLNPHVRYQRARWPNGNENKGGSVREWVKPLPLQGEEFLYIDLTDPHNPTGFIKNDSTMTTYNTYVSGKGGMCDSIWDTSYSSSYWCSDRSGGGWAEVDYEFAKAGTVGLPVGMQYYQDDGVGQRISSWENATNAIIHARHSQGWFSNMWEIVGHNKTSGVLHFGKGGSQGGRSWCRCDQCKYAGPWCKRDDDGNVVDDRLIGGGWFVENIREELDMPGEFFFDESSRTLFLLLNETDVEETSTITLIVPNLATLVDIDGADRVQLSNIGFRDSRYTYLEKHGVPSGGDWSLYKGAALQIANTLRTSIKGCTFSHLDGTAIILTERTRGVVIEENHFEWLGESAVAAWGHTDEWDGRDGRQPRYTTVRRNVVREIGLYETQSSAWFQAKSCNNVLKENLFFNMPRAAININDGFGGGSMIERNLIFNTCRESGDHGPINTWDRQPFLWDASGEFSFNTPPTTISKNFIVANYGGSQGIDNDDGSSFYHITNNVIIGEGLKADYGGHDSIFDSNLVVVSPYDSQNCINVNHFRPGHQHKFFNNICAILSCNGRDCDDLIGYTLDGCSEKEKFPMLLNNTYYTKHANASLSCGDETYTLGMLQKLWHIDIGSTSNPLPQDDEMVNWIFGRVRLWQQVEKQNSYSMHNIELLEL